MKKCYQLFALALALCFCFGLAACAPDSGLYDVTYELLEDGSGYAITGCELWTNFGKVPEEVRIPDTYEGLPVTAIHKLEMPGTTPQYLFDVQRYIIPSSITYIASGALNFAGGRLNTYEPDHDMEFVFEAPEKIKISLFRQFSYLTHTSMLKLPAFTILASDDIHDWNSYVFEDCSPLKTIDLSECKFETKDVDLKKYIGYGIFKEISKDTARHSILLPGGYNYKDVNASTKISFFIAATYGDQNTRFYFDSSRYEIGDVKPSLYWYSETLPTPAALSYSWRYVDGVPTPWADSIEMR